MLDALKSLAGGGKAAQKQAEELEALIATARDERSALSAMLTQVTMRSGQLTETGKTLEDVSKKAATATDTLEALTGRLDEIQRQASTLVDVEKRAQSLDATISLAQAKTERLIAPDGDLEKHRRDIQGVASAAADVQGVVETVKRERAALEDVQKQIQQAHDELRDVRQSVEQAAALRTELEQLRAVASQLTQDYSKAREISREADDDAFAALEAVKDIERRLSRLARLQELGSTTDEKLTALNTLAEHVTQKTRLIEGQKHVVDRAVVEINHVNELVWKMDAQISKVNEGFTEVARGEELIARVDALNAETRIRMEKAERTRDEFITESARLEKDGRELVAFMRSSVERITLEKKESEVLEQRLRTLHEAVQASESRLETLAGRER
jgi:chromosome segregation ATPase